MDPVRVLTTLTELLDEIERATEFVGVMPFDRYATDWKTKRAAERSIAIISEACRRVPEALYAHAPEVPWSKIRGIGNILRHEYDDVADEVIYAVITEDLVILTAAIRAIAAALDRPET